MHIHRRGLRRLREIREALHDDPVLLRECLARPALVNRLSGSSSAARDPECLDDICPL
jgi:hypothetical protein